LKLKYVLNNIEIVKLFGSPDQDVLGITEDSRRVKKGYLFAAIKGSEGDGHRYIPDALDRNAAAVLAEEAPQKNLDATWIHVKNSRRALSRAACNFYGNPSANMLTSGITGTNGKTTVSYLLQNILEAAGYGCGLIGTVEYRYDSHILEAARTTPDAPSLQRLMKQMRDSGARAIVMEVSSHALDQHRVDDVDFDLGIFTNLTQDHLDYHRNMESYSKTKERLFTELLPCGDDDSRCSVINIDDLAGAKLIEKIAGCRFSYAIDSPADVTASDIRLSAGESSFIINYGDIRMPIRSKLLGRHNIYNCLAAAAGGFALGVDKKIITKAVEETKSIPGRLERIPSKRDLSVYVDYAHTDDALKNVISTLREIISGKIILVFGCGGDRDRDKRPKMGRVAARMADFSVITSDNPRGEDPLTIITQIEQGFDGDRNCYRVEEDRKKAIETAISMAEKGDAVLIAGKGHENYQIYQDKTIHLDDREVAGELLN